jgi:hypothetical protein
VEPLLWLYEYDSRFPHPFLFKRALELPAGTLIDGIPPAAIIHFLPGKKPHRPNPGESPNLHYT